MIGKIKRVELRSIWKNESSNFTTWMENNIDALNEAIGFDLTGRPRETFARLEKTGSDLDLLLDDIGVLISLALQHGASPADLAHSMGRVSSGERSSILGHLVDALAAEVAA